MIDDEVLTHRDVVWSLPESVRMDFIIMADELAHHRRVIADLCTAEPGAFWVLPLSPQVDDAD